MFPKIIDPEKIEEESFRIIEAEVGPHAFSDLEFQVARRVVHATADFEFVKTIRFHPDAIASGIDAWRCGASIVIDVEMIKTRISKVGTNTSGGAMKCYISEK